MKGESIIDRKVRDEVIYEVICRAYYHMNAVKLPIKMKERKHMN